MISTAIYAILYADSSVKGMVDNRIYPNVAVQTDAMPYIVYSKVSKVPADSKDNGTGFDKYRIEIDCFHSTYTNCELLASYVRTALDRKSGSYGGMTIINSVYEDENDVLLGYQDNSNEVYQIAVDFMIIAK